MKYMQESKKKWMEVIGGIYEETVRNLERLRRKTRIADIPVCRINEKLLWSHILPIFLKLYYSILKLVQ